MHTFVAEAAALSLTGSPMLRRFFVDTWAWLGGSREWHATTGRYHAECDGERRATPMPVGLRTRRHCPMARGS